MDGLVRWDREVSVVVWPGHGMPEKVSCLLFELGHENDLQS